MARRGLRRLTRGVVPEPWRAWPLLDRSARHGDAVDGIGASQSLEGSWRHERLHEGSVVASTLPPTMTGCGRRCRVVARLDGDPDQCAPDVQALATSGLEPLPVQSFCSGNLAEARGEH